MDKKFKGFSSIRPGATKEFTPDFYLTPGQDPTGSEPVFTITYPSISEKQSIYDRFYDGNYIAKGMTGAAFVAAILPRVKGMRNTPVAFKADAAGNLETSVYDIMDFELRSALYSEIMKGGELKDEESNGTKS